MPVPDLPRCAKDGESMRNIFRAGTCGGFSYVGACQLVAMFHIVASWLASGRARVAQALPRRPERRVPARGASPQDSILVSTLKRPRRGHSAIRVREDLLPTHEITCGRIDAHSHIRALVVETLAHKTGRAAEPRFSLRGPVNTHCSMVRLRRLLGLCDLRSIDRVAAGHLPQGDQQLTSDCDRGRFLARATARFSANAS